MNISDLSNLENAVNLFYKSRSTDQAQLNEYLVSQQKSPLGRLLSYYFLYFRIKKLNAH
jgi:hypothetical protein